MFAPHRPPLLYLANGHVKWLTERMEIWRVHRASTDDLYEAEVYVCPGCVDWQCEIWFAQFCDHANFWAAEEAADAHLQECPSFQVLDALTRIPN